MYVGFAHLFGRIRIGYQKMCAVCASSTYKLVQRLRAEFVGCPARPAIRYTAKRWPRRSTESASGSGRARRSGVSSTAPRRPAPAAPLVETCTTRRTYRGRRRGRRRPRRRRRRRRRRPASATSRRGRSCGGWASAASTTAARGWARRARRPSPRPTAAAKYRGGCAWTRTAPTPSSCSRRRRPTCRWAGRCRCASRACRSGATPCACWRGAARSCSSPSTPSGRRCRPVWKSKCYGAFVLNHRVVLHAIDATPARRRGGVNSSPLDRARRTRRTG